MSIHALNWAINQPIKNSGAKFVLTILANFSDEHGISYPSQETLAEKCSMTDRAVRNHLSWLEEYGYISKTHRRYKHKISTDEYQLEFVKPKKESKPLSRKRKQPENISASDSEQPEKNSASKQPENISKPSGKHFQKHQENISGNTKEAKDETSHTHNSAPGRETENPVCVSESKPEEYPPPDQVLSVPPFTVVKPAKNSNQTAKKFGEFRDELEQWWCELHGIRNLPPDPATAAQVTWFFENSFTLAEIQEFYDFATTDPKQKSWRDGNVTLGAIMKGIVAWRKTKKPADGPKPSRIDQCKLCDTRGFIKVVIGGIERNTKCKHENPEAKS